MKTKLLLLALLIITIASCNKDDEPKFYRETVTCEIHCYQQPGELSLPENCYVVEVTIAGPDKDNIDYATWAIPDYTSRVNLNCKVITDADFQQFLDRASYMYLMNGNYFESFKIIGKKYPDL